MKGTQNLLPLLRKKENRATTFKNKTKSSIRTRTDIHNPKSKAASLPQLHPH